MVFHKPSIIQYSNMQHFRISSSLAHMNCCTCANIRKKHQNLLQDCYFWILAAFLLSSFFNPFSSWGGGGGWTMCMCPPTGRFLPHCAKMACSRASFETVFSRQYPMALPWQQFCQGALRQNFQVFERNDVQILFTLDF